MIQSVMLAALGFVAASLLALLIAPAFWARAVRLTNQRLRKALPISEQEIRADKDLLRAEYALKVHQLEREVDQGRLAAHRQQIEINRRDIEIRRLTDTLKGMQAELTEHLNARSVLKQTVTERIPVLEASLANTRQLLQARDAAFDDLQAASDRQSAALEDGRAILAQRALEVQRLQSLFQEASAQGRNRGDGGIDGLALRAEVESLKARLAERAAVIDRLQGEVAARPRSPVLRPSFSVPDEATNEQLRAFVAEQSAEIAQLRRNAANLPTDIAGDTGRDVARDLAAQHLQALETQAREQADEISRLRAENDAISRSGDAAANARVRESKVWLKARIERIEGDLDRERDATGRLKAELAATNERLARQGMQLRDQLKRHGAQKSVPASQILRDTGKPVPPVAADLPVAPDTAAAKAPPPIRAAISNRARELQRALQGHFGQAVSDADLPAQTAPLAPASDAVPIAIPLSPPPDTAGAAEAAPSEQPTRGRLLDRLKSYEQA